MLVSGLASSCGFIHLFPVLYIRDMVSAYGRLTAHPVKLL